MFLLSFCITALCGLITAHYDSCPYLHVVHSLQRMTKSHIVTGTEFDLNKQSSYQRSKGVQRSEQNYGYIGSVHSSSNQGTVPTNITLGMGLEFPSELELDLNNQSSYQRSKGVQRSEQSYAYIGSVPSSSNQGTVPTNITLGMGPEFPSELELDLSKQSSYQRSKGVLRSDQNYAYIGLVPSSSNQGTVPTNITLGMRPEFPSELVLDLNKQSIYQRSKGVQRSEQSYAYIGSVPSSSNQGTVPTNITLGMGPELPSELELDLSKQSSYQRSKGVQRSDQNYAYKGSVPSSNQGTVPTNITLGMGTEFPSELELDLNKQSIYQRSKGVQRSEQSYAYIGSVPSSSNQGTVPTNITLGMGPEFPSELVDDGFFYTGDSESLDRSESSNNPEEDEQRRKKTLSAQLIVRRRRGGKRTQRDKDLNKQSNSQRSKGVERSERNELYAHLVSVLSSSIQGNDPTNITSGIGPELCCMYLGHFWTGITNFLPVLMLVSCIVRFFIAYISCSNKRERKYRKIASSIWTRRRVY